MWLVSPFISTKFLKIEVRAEAIAVVYKRARFSSYSRNGAILLKQRSETFLRNYQVYIIFQR